MLKNKRRGGQNGDTLIEVLFAITVFAFIVVSSLSLMNQGISAAQRSLEITTVRQTIDGQAEVLRFLHESYIQSYNSGTATGPAEEYSKILAFANSGRTEASPFGGTSACKVPSDPSKDFILNPVSATFATVSTGAVFQTASAYAQLTNSGTNVVSQGIWVEPIASPKVGTDPGYTDFHIRACWDAVGSSIPMNLGTIVRLYDPRN